MTKIDFKKIFAKPNKQLLLNEKMYKFPNWQEEENYSDSEDETDEEEEEYEDEDD